MGQAQTTYGNLANFQPVDMQAVDVAGSPIQAGQLASTDMGQYMNPYTQQVIERGQADIERQRQMATQSLGAQAQQAKAFGGSRHGVAEGTLGGEYARMGADLAAQQRQQAFQQAQKAAQYDIGQRYAADIANRQAEEAAAARQQAANLANYQGQFTGAGIQQAAASGLAGLGQQGFNIGSQIQQQQAQQGLLQQGLQQALIDAAKGQYAGFTGAPAASLSAPLAALGATPNQSTTTQSQTPGLFNYLQTLAMMKMCWVAREVYGEDDPRWLEFRDWVVGHSPDWFFNAYDKYGARVAKIVKKVPILKSIIRPFMDAKRKSIGYK
jgi:hypothetical protein